MIAWSQHGGAGGGGVAGNAGRQARQWGLFSAGWVEALVGEGSRGMQGDKRDNGDYLRLVGGGKHLSPLSRLSRAVLSGGPS